jgi:hypothetical protein
LAVSGSVVVASASVNEAPADSPESVPPIVVPGVQVTATFVIGSSFESAAPLPLDTPHVEPAAWALIVTS